MPVISYDVISYEVISYDLFSNVVRIIQFNLFHNYTVLIRIYSNFICNSNNIENIQIYFTKILFYRCNLTKRSYEDRIIFLNIKTLFHRRLLADLTLTYKILNGLVDVDETDIFDLFSNNCRGPKVKIRKK